MIPAHSLPCPPAGCCVLARDCPPKKHALAGGTAPLHRCRPRAANVDVSPSPTAAVWRRRPTKSMFQVLAPSIPSARASRRPAAAAHAPGFLRASPSPFIPIHPSRSGHTPFRHPSLVPVLSCLLPVPCSLVINNNCSASSSGPTCTLFCFLLAASVLSDSGIFPGFRVCLSSCLPGTPSIPQPHRLRLCASCVSPASPASPALSLQHRSTAGWH